MRPLIFPKIVFLHEAGWHWLMGVHPSVTRLYLLYVVPLSVIPPVMLLYAWYAYRQTLLTEVSLSQALLMCVILFLVELAAVPAMGAVFQRIGEIADVQLPYRDAFALAAVAPTPLWLAPLSLLVPSLLVNVVILALALAASGLLIYRGVPRVFHVDDASMAMLLAGSLIAAGLVAWVGTMVLAFVIWGVAVA